MKLSDAAKAEIAEAVRIVREDMAKLASGEPPKDEPPKEEPTEGQPPPVREEKKDKAKPDIPVRKSLWWGDRASES